MRRFTHRVAERLRRRDNGMVTAELAMCLPVLALVLLVALAAVSVTAQRLRAQDAASEVARASARGDPGSGARLFKQTAPAGSKFSVATTGGMVTVIVHASLRPLGGWLGSYSIDERAVAEVEPDASAGP
jgi:Flp pilus assembly protein TadG